MFEKTRAYDLDVLVPTADDAIGASLRRYGEFARPELDFLLDHATEKTGVFLDVGANLGAIALPFGKARTGWRVLAIEAHRGLSNLLAANTHLNQLNNVEPIHAAAGREAGLAQFPAPPLSAPGNHGTLSFYQKLDLRETVRMLQLDEISGPDTRLVKIDVEGYEAEVLAGARGLLAARRTVWVVEVSVRFPDVEKEVLQLFRDAGYGTYWLFAPFATPASPKGPPTNPMIGDVNLVALPRAIENGWALPAATTAGAHEGLGARDYPYLKRYGYGVEAGVT